MAWILAGALAYIAAGVVVALVMGRVLARASRHYPPPPRREP